MRRQFPRRCLSIAILASLLGTGLPAQAAECFLDASRLSASRDLDRRIHPPERKEISIRFDAPWEGPECGYVTVLRDGDRFLLYYRGGGDSTREVTCVATSSDAIINGRRPDRSMASTDATLAGIMAYPT